MKRDCEHKENEWKIKEHPFRSFTVVEKSLFACFLMSNYCVCIFLCVSAFNKIVCACVPLLLLSTESFVFFHSLQYCYVYLSDWLFYSGFWVNQSPSSASTSSSSFFGYCSMVQRFQLPVLGARCRHKSQIETDLIHVPMCWSMLFVPSLYNTYIAVHVCLITQKAIIKHQYALYPLREWNPNKFRAANKTVRINRENRRSNKKNTAENGHRRARDNTMENIKIKKRKEMWNVNEKKNVVMSFLCTSPLFAWIICIQVGTQSTNLITHNV